MALKIGCSPLLDTYSKLGRLDVPQLTQAAIDRAQGGETREEREKFIDRVIVRQKALEFCFPTIHVSESWMMRDVPIQGELLEYLLRKSDL